MRRFTAPGRANLIGEHTDHTGGLVLPAAIDRTIDLDCVLGGETIVIDSREMDGRVAVPADGTQPPAQGWGRFVSAVAHELSLLGRAPIGLRGHLESDVPTGAGLSSSAALEVVLALALCAAADLELAPLELAALCRRAEHRAVGVPSGIMDQAAAVLGREGHAVMLDCTTLEHRYAPLPDGHTLLLIHSGVQRELETSGYAQRTQELAAALPVLGDRRPAEVSPDELDRYLPSLPPVPARRLRHVVTENARVGATERALRDGDLAALDTLFAASHASLRDDFEVSVPELDALVEFAGDAGAVAARMTGGGFGGCIVALVGDDRVDDVADEVCRRYADHFPATPATPHPCRAADGAHEVG